MAHAPEVLQPPRLRRRLGLAGATVMGVGVILGAGIYVLIGEAAADAGSAVWVSFVIAAAIAGATGLAYAELAAMIPEAGASSAYAQEAWGARAGFVVGWLRVVVGVTGAAAVALGFAGYVEELFGWPPRLVAAGLLVVNGAIVVAGIRETVAVAAVMTLLEAAGLVFVIFAGLPTVGERSLLESPHGLLGIVGTVALVFFAFEGFEQVATLSEETRDPERNIPLAILLSIAITTVVYVLVAVVAVSAVAWEALGASSAPLALVVEATAGERPADVLSTLALFATANTALLLLAAPARIVYGMAGRGTLPRVLGSVLPATGTPWLATLVVTTAAVGFALAGPIGFLARTANFAIFLAFVVVDLALIWLRRTQPRRPRPVRIPASLAGVPVIPALAAVASALMMLATTLASAAAGAVLVLAGVALALVFVDNRDARRSQAEEVEA